MRLAALQSNLFLTRHLSVGARLRAIAGDGDSNNFVAAPRAQARSYSLAAGRCMALFVHAEKRPSEVRELVA